MVREDSRIRKILEVIRHEDGNVEFRVDGRHVLFLGNVTFEKAREAAYNYAWDRSDCMWTIKGVAL